VADGTTTTDQQGEEQPPPPPDQQIQMEISLGSVLDRLGGLFGADWEPSAGGGGTGGQFMFASIEELDGVITQWKDQREAILRDGRKVRDAAAFITAPAGDSMSTTMADTTMQSLDALYEHNQAMFNYADAYIQKLEASRASMTNTDEGGKQTMDAVHQESGQ
jgi:hypothetical protein